MIRAGWESVIVAASGPSLTSQVATVVQQARARVLAINDAWKVVPFADVLYACDWRWWNHEDKAPRGNQVAGERWSSHDPHLNDKLDCAKQHGLQLVDGADSNTFCFEAGKIHYGGNSGFQGLNLAMQFGGRHIILVGFDMRKVDGMMHFFGAHPPELDGGEHYEFFCNNFNNAKETLPECYRIVNATPGSALHCFPEMSLDAALKDRDLYRNRAVINAAAG